MNSVLTWMENSALARAILDSTWAFPLLETLHFVGLILLAGSLCVIDLRFLGFAATTPLRTVSALIPVSLAGFAINLTTGILFLFADPFRYYPNPAFRLKMLAVLLAGLNAICFKWLLDRNDLFSAPAASPAATLRWTAGVSLLLWTSVIVLGRLIPYLE